VTTLPETLQTIQRYRVHEVEFNAGKLDWIPYAPGSSWKPLRFDVRNGRWVALVKVDGPGRINRHQHTGQVLGYCLEGDWRYLEHPWVARPGSFVYEPPGEVHTLVSDNPRGMLTLFMLEGTMKFFDDDEKLVDEQDVFWYLDAYAQYCRDHDTEVDESLIY
jgi:anti-sigma factor ChrR (cupin superfamily)